MAPLSRTCSRCGKKGNTDNIHANLFYKLDDGLVGSVYLQKWKDFCNPCDTEVHELIAGHMKGLVLLKEDKPNE